VHLFGILGKRLGLYYRPYKVSPFCNDFLNEFLQVVFASRTLLKIPVPPGTNYWCRPSDKAYVPCPKKAPGYLVPNGTDIINSVIGY
jgi:hypothetical protein